MRVLSAPVSAAVIPAHYVHVGHDCQPDFDQVGVPDKFSPWQEKSEKL
jgi:hypothetical protein